MSFYAAVIDVLSLMSTFGDDMVSYYKEKKKEKKTCFFFLKKTNILFKKI